jgi:hypothetical protein
LDTDKKQYFIDFSERLILLGYKPYSSWVFPSEEAYLKYVKDTFDGQVLL